MWWTLWSRSQLAIVGRRFLCIMIWIRSCMDLLKGGAGKGIWTPISLENSCEKFLDPRMILIYWNKLSFWLSHIGHLNHFVFLFTPPNVIVISMTLSHILQYKLKIKILQTILYLFIFTGKNIFLRISVKKLNSYATPWISINFTKYYLCFPQNICIFYIFLMPHLSQPISWIVLYMYI